MSEYTVNLKDSAGFDITTETVDGIAAAKKRAKYLLTDDYAAIVGTDHKSSGTYKAEVLNNSGECVWDVFA